MSVFPLNIPEKINTPALQAFFQQFGLDRYLSAEEINKITAALAELNEVSGNVSIINTIFVNNGFDKTGQLFTGFANSQWNINGFNYTNPTDQEITIPLCSTGKERTDRIVLDTNNNFARIQGIEVDENPVPPAKPANTLDYTFIPVNDTEVGDPTPPILGSNFNKKIYDNFYTYTGTGTDVVIPLPHDGQSNIYLSGSMTSVAGFDFSEFLANPTNAEYPHTGKNFMLTNLSGHDITLLNGVGTLDVFFDLIGGTDLVIPDGKSVFFNGNTNVFVEINRNWIDTSNKLDKVTTKDVEKVYIKNADGTQGTKPTSDFGTIKGTGTTNRISKFTAGGTIGDSQIFDDGTNVGIGTTTPTTVLDVQGNYSFNTGTPRPLKIAANSSTTTVADFGTGMVFGLKIGSGSVEDVAYIDVINTQNFRSGEISFKVSQGSTPIEAVRINYVGNVGIGTTSPRARLDVRAQGGFANDIAFRVRNSTDTANLLQINGQGTLSLGLQSSPPTGIEGAIYYDSTKKKHYGFDGITWNALY